MSSVESGWASWAGPDDEVGRHVVEFSDRCLRAYRENPALVEEHANGELAQKEGGYGRRQLFELIQNGADELLDAKHRADGRIAVVLTDSYLYCANQGRPVTPDGAEAILSAYRSPKKGVEIGRFGLGFKSVLGASSKPQFFSRSGSFGFDPAVARERIRQVVPTAGACPTLRLGFPLQPGDAAAEDSTLADLMSWATSVVRLPLDQPDHSWLHSDLADFPAAFLVFSPQVASLELEDRVFQKPRVIQLKRRRRRQEYQLEEDGRGDNWRVFSVDHTPSEAARKDAGFMADREKVRVTWAVPANPRGRRGELWAYFPTDEETTLSGVVNAPWKLSDDRMHLIKGPFNRELLLEACDLVLHHLDELVPKADPGLLLEILPARGREAPNWADKTISDTINESAPLHPSLPDQDGELELPTRLILHPDGLPQTALEAWAEVSWRPKEWVHRSVDLLQTRRARAREYMQAVDGTTASVEEWLEALIRHKADPEELRESSRAALRVAGLLAGNAELEAAARHSRIVLTSEGALVAPDKSPVFLPGEHPLVAAQVQLVDAELAGDAQLAASFTLMGVRRVDPLLELQAFLDHAPARDGKPFWDLLWKLVRRVSDPLKAAELLRDHGLIGRGLQVRTADGNYVRLIGALLPGPVVDLDTLAHANFSIDTTFHQRELRVLRALGAVDGPQAGAGSLDEPVCAEYVKSIEVRYYKELRGARPSYQALGFQGPRRFAGPLTAFRGLPDDARERFTKLLMEVEQDLTPFVYTHLKQLTDRYRRLSVDHPVVWALRRYGLLTAHGQPVGPDLWVSPELGDWASVLPIAPAPDRAVVHLKLPRTLEDLETRHWDYALERVEKLDDDVLIGRFYGAAVSHVERPEQLRCRVSAGHEVRATTDVRFVTSSKHLRVLAGSGRPVILVSEEQCAALQTTWQLRNGEEEISTEVVFAETAAPTPLSDVYPALRLSLRERARTLQVQRCSELQVDTFTDAGRESEQRRIHLDTDTIWWRDDVPETEFLTTLFERLATPLPPGGVQAIIDNRLNQEARRLARDIAEAGTPAEKLLVAVGGANLRARLPAALLEAAEELRGELDDSALADLMLAVYGVDAVRVLRDDLEERGLLPPERWSGSRAAVEFVRGLGLEPAFAGFPGGRRDSTLEVDGPPELKDLHDYQRVIVSQIRRLLRGEGGSRGLLSLPTGAGKTRVAIESLVDAVASEELVPPILWIAQSDELCEQAVQTWSEVWPAKGPRQRLVVSRLWSTNEAEPAADATHVVVATIDKALSCSRKGGYDWLTEAGCVVIDEAHGTTTREYTEVLDWQGIRRNVETRCPLLGLTATPFRGKSVTETETLVRRFGQRRLDEAAFGDDDPYSVLQERGVLARVEMRRLAGSDFALSERELLQVKQLRRLPSGAEDRLGADVDRNRTLLTDILSLPDDWPVLLFATSVPHAQVMAALLTQAGVPAATITSGTEPGARRHYVDQFRDGSLRVLTNYGVLTQGFDAPKVRAVYVGRPTYSPNVYQQMIGRGLRGPLNGGEPECLIVNVEDNIVNYGEQLAFTEFEHLWGQREPV